MGIKDWLENEEYSGFVNEMDLNDCLTGVDCYDRIDPDGIEWDCYEGMED